MFGTVENIIREEVTREDYIDWLITSKGYSYQEAVKTANVMGF